MPTILRNAIPYILLTVVVSWVCYEFIDPISRNDSHWGRMVIAGISIGLVLAYSIVMSLPELQREVGRKIVRAVMLATVIAGVFNYYQFDRKVWSGLGDSSDITYYYVNSKYLPELGYFSLYPAMIVADMELNDHYTSKLKQYRDLRDYKEKPTSEGIKHGKQIKAERFTPERWEEFKHDADFFLSNMRDGTKKYFYSDHGYNPPPTWSVSGSFLSNLADAKDVKSIARVDILLVAITFAGVAWAFGFDTMLFGILFFVCTMSGRWPILGEALLRFDWVSTLVLSMCCLKKEKYALAGGLMAYAGLNRIFPMIFFWGWGAVAMYDTIRHRAVLPRHYKFAGGAALVAVLLIGAATARFGPETFRESAHNLSMHNRSYSSYRVGLGDLLLFRGEKSRSDQKRTVYALENGKQLKGIAAKERKIQNMQPLLRIAALGAVVFLTLYGWRSKREEVWWLIPLAILPFYCATNAQINYYNLRLLLIVWHGYFVVHGGRDLFFHRLGLLLLFVCELATQGAFLTPIDPAKPAALVARYYVTCTTSVWMGIYLSVLIVKLVKEGWFDKPQGLQTTEAQATI